jgi:peptidoglycan lytic transglycosylase D
MPELRALLAALAVTLGGCAHAPPVVAPPTHTGTIAEADAHLARGLALADANDLPAAQRAFDRALDVYLSVPGGALTDPGLASAYRATLEQVRLRELALLAARDVGEDTEPAFAIPELPARVSARREAEAALARGAHDFPVELNARVLSAIDLFEGRRRSWFDAALARSGRYRPLIRRALAEQGLPSELTAVALVESAFLPDAVSRASARGIWQFMPATGRRYGLRQDFWIDERSDPPKSTRAAARYLRELHDRFGDWNLALAAYNCGENRVERAIRRHRTRDFWRLSRRGALPRETRQYVPLIHAAVVVLRDPARYGFAQEADSGPPTQPIVIDFPVDLRAVAGCASLSFDELRSLNPALRRTHFSAASGVTLHVPAPEASGTLACLLALPESERGGFTTHVVRRGQTLSGIAGRYRVSMGEIAAANGRRVHSILRVGERLLIPRPARVRATRAAAAQPD